MRLPRGVVPKHGRLFGRVHAKGGEHSFPLGPASDPGAALQRFYTIRALIRQGTGPSAIKDALKGELGLNALAPPGTVQTEPDVTVGQAVKRWIREHVEPDLEDAENIKSRIDRLLLPFIGSKPIREVRRADCHAFKGHIRATCPGLKPGTVIHYLRMLRELLAWAENVELITESPWPRKGIMPRSEKRPPDRLTDEEAALLVALPDPWGFNLRLALGTGCRWGELCRLRRTDLQPDGVIQVREAKDGEPRKVPIGSALLREIMQRKGPLFTTRDGTTYSETSNGAFNTTIRRLAKERVKALPSDQQKALEGLVGFHIHMTRHTYACTYLEAGGELAMLQEILGHASVVTTQRYGRPNEKAIRADAARVYAIQEVHSRS